MNDGRRYVKYLKRNRGRFALEPEHSGKISLGDKTTRTVREKFDGVKQLEKCHTVTKLNAQGQLSNMSDNLTQRTLRAMNEVTEPEGVASRVYAAFKEREKKMGVKDLFGDSSKGKQSAPAQEKVRVSVDLTEEKLEQLEAFDETTAWYAEQPVKVRAVGNFNIAHPPFNAPDYMIIRHRRKPTTHIHGEPWFQVPAGAIVEVPESVALRLIKNGGADKVKDKEKCTPIEDYKRIRQENDEEIQWINTLARLNDMSEPDQEAILILTQRLLKSDLRSQQFKMRRFSMNKSEWLQFKCGKRGIIRWVDEQMHEKAEQAREEARKKGVKQPDVHERLERMKGLSYGGM